jgi:hypothetical protein
LRIATYYYLRKGSDSRLFGGFCCAEVLKNNNRHIAALATNRGVGLRIASFFGRDFCNEKPSQGWAL